MASYRYHGAQVGDLALRDKDRHIAKCRRSIILALVLAWLAFVVGNLSGRPVSGAQLRSHLGLFGARCGRISYFKTVVLP